MDRDCTKWAHDELRQRLLAIPGVTGIEQLEGEVSVAQRKGKLRHLYDLTMRLKLADGGCLEIRDWLSDTTPEDLEMTWKSSPRSEEIIKALWAMMREFEQSLMEEHGQGLLVAQVVEEKGSKDAAVVKEFKQGGKQEDAGPVRKEGGSLGDWREEVEFNCTTEGLMACLTRGDRIRAWSRSDCPDLQVDLVFSLFAGNVQCKVLDMAPTRLKMEWKLSDWTAPSIVTITLHGEDDRTRLKLTQTHLPQADLERVKENWSNYYWNPIKLVFGYGYLIH